MRCFEYRRMLLPADESAEQAERRLNELGNDGWQLVQIVPGLVPLYGVVQVGAWMMREKQ
jgi:hypothetical protein